jgi:hypothetical protein
LLQDGGCTLGTAKVRKWFLQQRTIPAGKKLHKNQEGAILTHSHSIRKAEAINQHCCNFGSRVMLQESTCVISFKQCNKEMPANQSNNTALKAHKTWFQEILPNADRNYSMSSITTSSSNSRELSNPSSLLSNLELNP